MGDPQRIYTLNRQRMANEYMTNKIKMKAALAVIRLTMLYFFYYLDNSHMTVFLQNLIGFLLIHEALVITNCLIVMVYQVSNQIISRGSDFNVPTFCSYLDLFNNL
jgi:hypothetical protein